jgi:hypothetical protein
MKSHFGRSKQKVVRRLRSFSRRRSLGPIHPEDVLFWGLIVFVMLHLGLTVAVTSGLEPLLSPSDLHRPVEVFLEMYALVCNGGKK